MSEKTNYKKIAVQMYHALEICMQFTQAKTGSSGVIATDEDMKAWRRGRHWREIVADAMELMPGVKIDREACHALDLPKRQREAYFKQMKNK